MAVDAALVEGIQNRAPTRGQFIECSFDQPRRPLGPGIKVGPRQGAAEGGMGLQAQPARRLGGVLQLLDRPRGSRCRIAAHGLGGKAVHGQIVSGMNGDHLTLQMSRQLGDGNAEFLQLTLHLVTVRLAFRCAREVEQTLVPGWNLHAHVTQAGRPAAHVGQ